MATYELIQEFASRTDPTRKPYRVMRRLYDNSGALSCDCPGWTRRNPDSGRTCRHVIETQNQLDDEKASRMAAINVNRAKGDAMKRDLAAARERERRRAPEVDFQPSPIDGIRRRRIILAD